MADFLNGMPLPESRQGIEDMIEALIARLDAADDDPDLEDTGDDEPTLGAADSGYGWSGHNLLHSHQPMSDECEADADNEPSLGALERHPGPFETRQRSQLSWGASGTDDREDACEDEGWQDDQESEGPLDAVRHWPCNPISFGATP
ncbi:hypothetical protein [Aestuariivirga sp.]|uniref:hypothetical protein n=1 Tax=Aestuariivirga sp. TaxID=2650926 RepID=UPI0039E56813